MAKYIVPSRAASGKDTFSDQLVGNQITNGTSELTNTNFDLDRVIPEKDAKNFVIAPFSEFLTLDTIKKETNPITTQSTQEVERDVKFNSDRNDGGKSLYGSLAKRLLVSIKNIILKFPAGFLIDKNSFINSNQYTAFNIFYDPITKITEFTFEFSRIFNPLDITLISPQTQVLIETDNVIRQFYNSYTKYVIDISGNTFNILSYTEPNSLNQIVLKINGDPFSGQTTFTENILIRPNNAIVETFYSGLDEIEVQLLDRETLPIYNAGFYVPRDSFDQTSTSIIKVYYNWPVSKDGWNIQITGSRYDTYVKNLSDIADEIDDWKSNLVVRFLTAAQLYEFDTDERKAEAVFQLYGQSFDKIKKYIDNIAYMRNVSYDAINNLPDILLKNLAENLGLSTLNLFDEKSLDDILYLRQDTRYAGISTGKNVIEAEFEFYRRLLVNLAFIYKSKGTRESLIFFLKFLGAPEPLIRVDEHIYRVISFPRTNDLETDIFQAIRGSKILRSAIYDPLISGYTIVETTGYTTYTRSGYPVKENTNLPRRAYDPISDMFFEKGAGWYKLTIDHRSRDIIDNSRSVLTGRTKVIKTMNKPFTYGEEYFDVFRSLPGLDTGFGLQSEIDNIKASFVDDDSPIILNRKNISVYLSASRAIDYDIWKKSRDLLLVFGSNTLYPQTGVTFAQYLSSVIHSQILNSNFIRYKKNYISLEDVYAAYIANSGYTAYNFIDAHEFIKKMSPYWTQVIDQIVPATTQWTGGNLIENDLWHRSKYKYQIGCIPKKITEALYPDFLETLGEDFETILGDHDNFRGLVAVTGITYYPVIEIDGVTYGGSDYNVVISGTTSTATSAKLFDIFPQSGCTSLPDNNDQFLPLICDYKPYLNPDLNKISELWMDAVIGIIDNLINVPTPIINYNFTTDSSGNTFINIYTIKTNSRDCSAKKIDYRFETEYDPLKSGCTETDVFTYCDVYETGTDNCNLVADVYIELSGITGVQQGGTGWPVYVFSDCDQTQLNQNITLSSGRSIGFIDEPVCKLFISSVKEHDDIHLNIVDAANCETVINIKGLYPACINNGLITGYTIEPIVEYTNSYNYGLKGDTIVWVFTDPNINLTALTNSNNLTGYINSGRIIQKEVKDLVPGDILLTSVYLPASGFTNGNIQSALTAGFKFSFDYTISYVTDVKCLASVKKSIITGLTKSGDITIFEVLPTTQLRVYTNKRLVSGSTTGFIISSYQNVITSGISTSYVSVTCQPDQVIQVPYYFDDRYPEQLQVPTTPIDPPCCSYKTNILNTHGDYLINVDGQPIEVLAVDLNYCEPNLYYNISVSGLTPFPPYPPDLKTFNGNTDYQVMLKYKYEHHFDPFGFDLQQFYTDVNCPVPPSVNDLIRPLYPNDCNNQPIDCCDIIEPYLSGSANILTPTPTPTPNNTSTPTPTPNNTSTPTPTPTPNNTSTPTPSPTPYPCNCLTWTATEVSTNSNITWIDCDNQPQSLPISGGTLNLEISKCGTSPDTDNPTDITPFEDTKSCSTQWNGTYLCVAPPCTLHYIFQDDPGNLNFAQDFTYDDCITGLQVTGSMGTNTPYGPCIAVYALPGTITAPPGLSYNTTGCFATPTPTPSETPTPTPSPTI